jgi:hypothetical protein
METTMQTNTARKVNPLYENISKTSTNAEIEQAFGTKLETGNPIVYHIGEAREGSDGKTYRALYIAQMRDDVSTSSSTVTDLQATLLGWNNSKRMVRTIANAVPDMINKLKINQGYAFENANIQIEHSFHKSWATQEPRKYGANSPFAGMPITCEGAEFYETTKLVSGPVQHVLFKPDPAEAVTFTMPVNNADNSDAFDEDF